MMDKFWKNKRVLVTGADGFIGSHLTEMLLRLKASVSVFVRGNSITGTTCYKLKNIVHLKGDLRKIITGNIASPDAISLIRDDASQIIFHLAADAYVPNSFEHPLEVFETNLTGTLNILTAAQQIKDIQRVVCTSSSEIYGSAQYAPIDEKHPLCPTSPYAASKVAADRASFSFCNTYSLPIAIIRPFNTYGPRHTYDVIPKFISLALAGKELTVDGSGEQTRDFTYIDDMVRAFLTMGSHAKAVGQTVNFGTGVDVSVRDVAEKIVRISGSKSKIVHVPERLAQVKQLLCDYRLAKSLFDYQPRFSIDEGLRLNIDWAKIQKTH
ncbi:MAG: GDP-mannose 4,6-dehydratase [Deltaproteobacteria bacterium]|nr:GDP-mannose 4,6-dehydratase [Deltaproteobacteria bacterium]